MWGEFLSWRYSDHPFILFTFKYDGKNSPYLAKLLVNHPKFEGVVDLVLIVVHDELRRLRTDRSGEHRALQDLSDPVCCRSSPLGRGQD